MPIEAVKIPQNVYVEDRIIGPITLKQIFLLLAGGGVSYAIYGTMQRAGYVGIGPAAIALIPLAITAAFAFVKIYGISLMRFLILLYETSKKPPIRVWQPRVGITIDPSKYKPKKKKREGRKVDKEPKQVDSIEQLSTMLDIKPLTESMKKDQNATVEKQGAVHTHSTDTIQHQQGTEEPTSPTQNA